MGLNALKILKISITVNSKKEILEYVQKYLLQSYKLQTKPFIIVTPNPEQIVLAQKNLHFAKILNQADVALPDGQGVVWASKFFNLSLITYHLSPLKKRIPGVEFMEDLIRLAAKEGYPVGLIGGRGGVAVKAYECLRARYPNLRGWVEEGPEFNLTIEHAGKETTEQYFRRIIEIIRKEKTSIVFIGLGAPKQEYFIASLIHHSSLITHHSLVLMSVGGAFDIISGTIARAPEIWQNLSVEWLWRLIHEPWRLKRQLALLEFLGLIIKEKIKSFKIL